MDETLKEAARQVPSLTVLVVLVIYFLRALDRRDSTIKSIAETCHASQQSATAAINENTRVLGEVGEAPRRVRTKRRRSIVIFRSLYPRPPGLTPTNRRSCRAYARLQVSKRMHAVFLDGYEATVSGDRLASADVNFLETAKRGGCRMSKMSIEADRPSRDAVFSAHEVNGILAGELPDWLLQELNEKGWLKPTCYIADDGQIVTAAELDAIIQTRGGKRSRGAPEKAYSYMALVHLRLFLFVRKKLSEAGVGQVNRRTADVVSGLARHTKGVLPASSRLVFVGRDVFFIDEAAVVNCLTGQLGIPEVLTDEVTKDLRGRIIQLLASQVNASPALRAAALGELA